MLIYRSYCKIFLIESLRVVYTPPQGDLPICPELGVTFAALQAIQMAPPGEGPKLLDDLKRKAKAAYRKWARALHPDHNKGDNEREKSEKHKKFSDLTVASKCIEALAYHPAPSPTPIPFNIPRGVGLQGIPPQGIRMQVVFRVDPRTNVRHVQETTYFVGSQPNDIPRKSPTSAGPQGINVVFIRPF